MTLPGDEVHNPIRGSNDLSRNRMPPWSLKLKRARADRTLRVVPPIGKVDKKPSTASRRDSEISAPADPDRTCSRRRSIRLRPLRSCSARCAATGYSYRRASRAQTGASAPTLVEGLLKPSDTRAEGVSPSGAVPSRRCRAQVRLGASPDLPSTALRPGRMSRVLKRQWPTT